METILITGASGLIGKHLTVLLKEKGYRVIHLSRSASKKNDTETFVWNIHKQTIDEQAVIQADHIIHLAGDGITHHRWSEAQKKEIIDSRVESIHLLYKTLQKTNKTLKSFVSASGIGIYGGITTQKIYSETDPPATDFLGTVCEKWEDAATSISQLGIRVVKLRTGIVLWKNGGALKKIAMPVKFFIGSPLGSGQQYMPWIHLDDICAMYLKALEDTKLHGPYNAIAPEHITNNSLTKMIAHVLHRPLFLPNVPGAILKLLLGEMAVVVLEGSRASSKKIQEAGFEFKYPTVKGALKELFQAH
ncbi:MAG TPA: TIGR01777 family oxidoreductase [Bacteroidia bacterium]|nr:TIGR01777 family oxidoreductase [Bacteroidia bacterium]HRG52648.1 TIGR01777 family oxidoreductase [Bacteroidia bacterium]